MKINGSKTKCMVIASSKSEQSTDPKLKVGSSQIKLEQHYPFLGVKVPSDLRFGGHVEKITTKGRKRNRVLKCMSGKKWGNTRETQRTIYVQFVRAAIEYASQSWNSWISKTQLEAIQRVQIDALRSVVGSVSNVPSRLAP